MAQPRIEVSLLVQSWRFLMSHRHKRLILHISNKYNSVSFSSKKQKQDFKILSITRLSFKYNTTGRRMASVYNKTMLPSSE